MRYYIIILLIITFFIESGLAQLGFNKNYPNNDGNDIGWSLVADNSGFLISAGSLCNRNTNNCNHLIRTDQNGNLLWERFLGLEHEYLGTNLQHSLISVTNGFLIYGTVVKESTDTAKLFLLELSLAGDSIWYKEIGLDGNNVSKQIHRDINGSGYILFGTVKYNSEPETYVQVTKVDSVGDVLWSKDILGDYQRYLVSSVDPLDDGGFLIGTTGSPPGSNDDFLEMFRIDAEGEVLWTYNDGEEPYENCDNFYAYWLPNDLIMYKHCRDTMSPDYPGYSRNPDQFLLMDTLGNKINKTVNRWVQGRITIQHVVELSNGDVLAMGDTGIPPSEGEDSQSVGYAVRIGREGGIVWERFYNVDAPGEDFKFEQFLDAVETPDGSIAFTGAIRNRYVIDNRDRLISDVWLFKVDSMGCFEPGCQDEYIVVGVRETEDGGKFYYHKYMDLYPNPLTTSDYLTVSFPDQIVHQPETYLVIRDMHGRRKKIIQIFPNNKESIINLSNFNSGIYFVSYYRSGQILQTERIVVTK